MKESLYTLSIRLDILCSPRVETVCIDHVLPLHKSEPVLGHNDVKVLLHNTYGAVTRDNWG